ncbi:ribonuclease P protein subunit [Candidatus Woesearchaeota archaeon]|nr:ribonuclease P protein subunit [Candidatus Woesearchaeota archaeon]
MRLLDQEFIGLTIIITQSKNKTLVGLKGKIVDETRDMITIKTSKGDKKLIKKEIRFQIIDGKTMEIDGFKIIGRPEDRIKK